MKSLTETIDKFKDSLIAKNKIKDNSIEATALIAISREVAILERRVAHLCREGYREGYRE